MEFSDKELHTIYQALCFMESDKILFKYFKDELFSSKNRIINYFENKRKIKFGF